MGLFKKNNPLSGKKPIVLQNQNIQIDFSLTSQTAPCKMRFVNATILFVIALGAVTHARLSEKQETTLNELCDAVGSVSEVYSKCFDAFSPEMSSEAFIHQNEATLDSAFVGLLGSEAITSLVGDKQLQAELDRALPELLAAIRPGREVPSEGVRAGLKESLADFQRKFPELTSAIHNSDILGPVKRSPQPLRRPSLPTPNSPRLLARNLNLLRSFLSEAWFTGTTSGKATPHRRRELCCHCLTGKIVT